MGVGIYRHNDKGFYETFTYQLSINKGRATTTQGTHSCIVGILPFLLSLLVKSFEKEIQSSKDFVDTTRG